MQLRGTLGIPWLCLLLVRVIIPVVQKYFLEILRGGGVVNEDSSIPIFQDALPRPIHAGDDNLFVVKYKSLVVHSVLYFHIVEIDVRCLKSLQSALWNLELTQNYSYILARLDFGRYRVDQFHEFDVASIASGVDILQLDVERFLHRVNQVQHGALIQTLVGSQQRRNRHGLVDHLGRGKSKIAGDRVR